MFSGLITDIPGILAGHAQNQQAGTGCTVVLCKKGAVAGVDVRGSAPGTRETDLIRPGNLVDKIHAVMLSGGSAFGLAAADGAVEYLERNGIGFDVGITKVPIVASAVLFDLSYKDWRIRPDRQMGYEACLNANSEFLGQGSVGAGTGATIGKILGIKNSMKGGIGTASLKIAKGVIVGAIVAVNAFGDCIDPVTGEIIAGARDPVTGEYLCTKSYMLSKELNETVSFENTTIGVVATNAKLTKEQANKIASMAHDGLARSISPVHTMLDGDTIFVMATGEVNAELNAIGVAAAEVVSRAVVNAVKYTNLTQSS
jgi:L-aminopeptidase/D-esterase-like protein